ncbi:MAG: heparinase II/III family protein, partial [Oscillospiraceae bacterium]|nr:heparinase II/III family protein [Oscillospiraceae bacterium]
MKMKIIAMATVFAMLVMILPLMGINTVASPSESAVVGYENFFVRRDQLGPQQAPVGGLLQVDSNTGALRRVAFVRFDISDYIDNLDMVESILLRTTMHQDGVNNNSFGFIANLLPNDLKHYWGPMGFNDADNYGLVSYTMNELYRSLNPAAVVPNARFYSQDILPQILAQIEADPNRSPIIAIRYDAILQPTVLWGVGAPVVENRPALVITTSITSSLFADADNMLKEHLGTTTSNNITLPTTFSKDGETVNISWESLNPSVISNTGVLVGRPGVNEENANVQLRATFTHNGVTRQFTYPLTVLRVGRYAGRGVISGDERQISVPFSITPDAPGVVGYLLRIPNDFLVVGREYIVLDAGGNEIGTIVRDMTDDYTTINVSGHVSGANPQFTVVSTVGTIPDGVATFILEGLGNDAIQVVNVLDQLELGDLSAIIEDLHLPTSVGSIPIRWETSNPAIISDTGRVDRPFASAGNAYVGLTAVAEVGGFVYRRPFLAVVIRQDGTGADFPPLHDPQWITDEDFFGVWNANANRWAVAPMLRYDLFPALHRVEAAVKAGDYELASIELLAYYRSRDESIPTPNVPTASGADMRTWLISELWRDMVLTFPEREQPLGITYIGPEWEWHTIDLHGMNIPRDGTLWLFASNKDGSQVEIHSHRHGSGNAAYLEMVIDGVTRTFPVQEDVHISAGANANMNFSNEHILISREGVGTQTMSNNVRQDVLFPFGSNTFRPYFKFWSRPNSDNQVGVRPEGRITSVRLRFYARSSEGTNRVFAISRNNLADFYEDNWNWNHPNHWLQIVSFREIGYFWFNNPRYFERTPPLGHGAGPVDWTCEYEWINGISRVVETTNMVARYRLTGDEELAFRSVQLMLSLWQQQWRGEYPRVLDAAWRTQHMFNTMFGTLNSNFLTPEMLVAQIKYARRHMEFLRVSADSGAANQTIAARLGYLRVVSFLPEIVPDGWWEDGMVNLRRLYTTFLVNPDGSFVEATTGYMTGVAREMREIKLLVGGLLGTNHPDYLFFADAYRRFTRYIMGMTLPHGGSPRWGSSNEIPFRDGILPGLIQYRPDPWLEYVATRGRSGERPPFLSNVYPDKANALLRDGWGHYNMGGFISSAHGGSHYHRGDLGLDVYAFGQGLLVEAGGTHYGDSPMWSSVRYTASHNTIQINNTDQNWFQVMPPGLLQWPQRLDMESNSMFDMLHAGTRPGIPLDGANIMGGGRSWLLFDNDRFALAGFDVNRKVFFLHNGFWIVSDFIYAGPKNSITYTEPQTYRQIWHADTHPGVTRPTLDPATGIFRTDFGPGRPNIQAVPVMDDTLQARINEPLSGITWPQPQGSPPGEPQRLWRNHSRYGETLSYYVTYVREDVTGHQTFDTVLFPDRPGHRTPVEVTRIPLNVAPFRATSMRIEMGHNTGFFYSSNEQIPGRHYNYAEAYNGPLTYRAFSDFSTDGSMAYIQKDLNEEITFIALTHATRLNHNGQELVSFNGTR